MHFYFYFPDVRRRLSRKSSPLDSYAYTTASNEWRISHKTLVPFVKGFRLRAETLEYAAGNKQNTSLMRFQRNRSSFEDEQNTETG